MNQERHPPTELLRAVMRHLHFDLDRAYGNLYQEKEAPGTPFSSEGGPDFICETFTAREYNLDEEIASENSGQMKPNFLWRDVEIWWYKHAIRGLETNRVLTNDEIAEMCDECIKAIRAWDDANYKADQEADRLADEESAKAST